jgi:hypothetical protein
VALSSALVEPPCRGGVQARCANFLQCEALADEQVPPPLVGRTLAARELDEDMPAFRVREELGMFASRGGAQLALGGAVREALVGGTCHGFDRAREPPVQRLLSEDEVAHAVLTPARQGDEALVIGPIREAGRQTQLGMERAERPSEVSLGAHVDGERRKALVQRAAAIGSLEPVAPCRQEVQLPSALEVACLLDSKEGQPCPKAGEGPGACIARGASLAHAAHVLACGPKEPRHRGLRHAQLSHQILRLGHTQAAED